MILTRRKALACFGGALAAPSLSRASESGARSYVVLRDGDDIGFQTNRVTRIGDTVTHEAEVELKIRIFGITAYRYELAFVEEWKAGALVRLDSTCNDDGEDHFVRAARAGDVIEIDGSGHQGTAPWSVATTSYWAFPFLRRRTWISTQTGEPLPMTAAPAGETEIATQGGAARADAWALAGGYEATVFYRNEDWVGITFDAGGEPAVYVPDTADPVFMPVWRASL